VNLSGPKSAVRRKRIAAIALAVVVALGIATAVAVPLERAAVSESNAAAAKKPHPLAMGSYPTRKYASAASTLPSGLVAALKRDVHLTPAQYLANSAAAIRGVKVVAALKAHGVHVLGSSMSGTRLNVNVASSVDAAAVTAAGAKAIIGAPKTTDYSKLVFTAVSASSTYGGEAYFYQDASQVATDSDEGFRCSIGFNGYAVSSGAPEFATAGHCATAMDGDAYPIALNEPTHAGGKGGVSLIPLGGMVAGEGQFGSEMDYGIVAENPSSYVAQPSLYTWGGAAKAPLSTKALGITGETFGITGATLCKSGSTSGWTCGAIKAIDQENTEVVDDNNVVHDVNAIIASTCLLPGDSGGGAVIGSAAAGIDSASDNITGSCTKPRDPDGGAAISIFFPMESAAGPDSVQGQQGPNWQLALSVAKPVVTSLTSGSTVTTAQNLAGTLATPTTTSTVSLYLDGSSTAASTVSASGGSWSFPLSALSIGHHSFSLISKSGFSSGTATAGSFTLAKAVPAIVSGGLGDFNTDGRADLIARGSTGTLYLYAGNGVSAFAAPVTVGTGWQGMTAIVPVGDFNGDHHPDIVARDAVGTLWLYPGNGTSGFGARVQLGAASEFASMTSIQGVGDFNGDGFPDILTRTSTGSLQLYPGSAGGTIGAPIPIASSDNWKAMTWIAGVGDFNLDGNSDLVARDASGVLWLYPGNGSGGLNDRIEIGAGWSATASIAGIGDFNHDGEEDVVVRDSAGALWLYPGNGAGGFQARIKMGTGWQSATIAGNGGSIAAIVPPTLSAGLGDFNGDGFKDLIARGSTGTLYLYDGNGVSAFSAPKSLGTGWQTDTAFAPAGDLNGDGKPDLVVRDSTGELWLYPGNGVGGFGTRVAIGSSTTWSGMTAIQGVGDLNGDGKPDLVARDSSGALYLFPGVGNGTLGSAIQITAPIANWSTLTAIVGAGDFNGDGKSDLIVRDSSGVLWLYPGNGDGTLGTAVEISAGWSPTAAIAGIGDFNRNGTEDLIVRDSVGALWLYPGNGAGGLLARIKISTGWQSATIAGNGATIAAVPPAS
jgi:hypothetical protein